MSSELDGSREKTTHLVRRVTDADVEVRKLGLDEIADDDVELALLGPASRVEAV